jgi:hypothetical protein
MVPAAAGQLQDVKDMRAAALKTSIDLRMRADEIEDAARTIASIAYDEGRSDEIDGPAWDRAEKILRAAGIPVPNSGLLVWS